MDDRLDDIPGSANPFPGMRGKDDRPPFKGDLIDVLNREALAVDEERVHIP
jgi:hypothetical protein